MSGVLQCELLGATRMDRAIESAFQAVPRHNFLPPSVVEDTEINAPLPIGYGQTNSQPETVAMMLEWLDVQLGDNVLDVGSGSGWTSALLAHLTGTEGQVTAVETVPQLLDFGRENCKRLSITNIVFFAAGRRLGWPAKAPYDRILVSAAADELPQELVDQLKPDGRMVVPVRHSILIVDKDAESNIEQTEKTGFVFVPLIS
jgi:protein-L-isoaspartate(D-aspartate) O-methyltransferase